MLGFLAVSTSAFEAEVLIGLLFRFRRGFSGCLDIFERGERQNDYLFQFRRGFSGCLDPADLLLGRRPIPVSIPSWIFWLSRPRGTVPVRSTPGPGFNSVVDFLAVST